MFINHPSHVRITPMLVLGKNKIKLNFSPPEKGFSVITILTSSITEFCLKVDQFKTLQ